MNRIIARALCLVALAFFITIQASAQQDKQVQTKQSDLKREYNDFNDKNTIIKAAAKDKPTPTKDRRRNITTGYDYTQVKGFSLRQGPLHDRLDKLFKHASDVNLLDEEYHLNGATTVPCTNGAGGASIREIQVFLVEATAEEMENLGINQYDLLEVRVVKTETCPEAKTGEEEEEESDEGGRRRRGGGMSSTLKAYSLSGADLWTAIKLTDESLYDDLISRRTQEQAINLPQDLFLPAKRGPFIVMLPKALETNTSRFFDFWNPKDTLNLAKEPETAPASGPFTTANVPVLFPSETKIRISNPNNSPLTIKSAVFEGSKADAFVVKTKVPVVLAPKGQQDSKQDIIFDYVGSSPYETHATLVLDAPEAKMNQGIDIVANPGKFPSDIVVIDASLDKIELRSPARSGFAPDWKLAYTIGNDQVSLPRWSSGISSLSVGYKHQMSVGLVMPAKFNTTSLPDPLAYSSNLFSSPMGYDVNFDFTFGFPFSIGGYLAVMNKFEAHDAYKQVKVLPGNYTLNGVSYGNDFFHIGNIVQVYYPIMFTDNETNPNISFRLNIGGGYMQIQRDHIVQPGETQVEGVSFTKDDVGKMFTLGKEKDLVDVYVRIGFINMAAKNTYGIGLQYFAGNMMLDSFLELTDWLRVDMKYSFLLRQKEVWETESSYFMVTPRFRIGIPSIFN